jgi:divinyl protochlorophyllide a 8-vinyl-reductase
LLGAPLLTRAIAAHAWTFVGSGEFRVPGTRPPTFEIVHNPVVRGEHADAPVCVWHAQVFERLFRRLVSDRIRVRETQCAAVDGHVCRFVVEHLRRDD